MAFDKKDLEQIEKIFEKSENNITSKVEGMVEKAESKVITILRRDITDTVTESENRIISVISREVADLSEINHAVIEKIDKISELEKRIAHIERKIGVAS